MDHSPNPPVGTADYLEVNRANWEARVPVHLGPNGYEVERYVADPTLLSDVVRFDLPRLGDISGKRVVHLQCHLGTDTLSLARLGATVTGLDFSPASLEAARELAAAAGADIDYVESDVYGAVDKLGAQQFDLVYTGVGALCWLPSIERWAQVVADLLVTGGELFIRDDHPVAAACGEPLPDGTIPVEYPYFNVGGTRFHSTETYAGDGTPLESPDTVQYAHGLAEIFNALWSAGLEITLFEEHDTSWRRFGDLMEDVGGGEFRLIDRPDRLPLSFTIRARKPASGSTN